MDENQTVVFPELDVQKVFEKARDARYRRLLGTALMAVLGGGLGTILAIILIFGFNNATAASGLTICILIFVALGLMAFLPDRWLKSLIGVNMDEIVAALSEAIRDNRTQLSSQWAEKLQAAKMATLAEGATEENIAEYGRLAQQEVQYLRALDVAAETEFNRVLSAFGVTREKV